MNAHAIGIIMREVVHRAIREIRDRRFAHEVERKDTPGKDEDFVTDADRNAQRVMDRALRECFPGFGIIAEEDNRRVPCTLGSGALLYWTVDPLDGTKAFIRGQSNGFGPMIALIAVNPGGEWCVIAACIGDANTRELFYFRPQSSHVHWILPDVPPQRLDERIAGTENRSLREQYVLLRDSPLEYPEGLQPMLRPQCDGGLFRGIHVEGGSIGLTFTRLWKGEVGAIILKPGRNTPWDLAPILGISQQLGFAFLRLLHIENPKWGGWMEMHAPELELEPVLERHYVAIMHRSRVREFTEFVISEPRR